MGQPEDSIRVAVHVHPGARRPHVGGTRGGSLVVKVRAAAVDGAANEDTLTMLAAAFEVKESAVTLERGSRRRDKIILIAGDAERLRERLAQLLEGG